MSSGWLSEAQCAAMEYLADNDGVGQIGHRPLTGPTVRALVSQGLVKIRVPRPSPAQAVLTPAGRKLYNLDR